PRCNETVREAAIKRDLPQPGRGPSGAVRLAQPRAQTRAVIVAAVRPVNLETGVRQNPAEEHTRELVGRAQVRYAGLKHRERIVQRWAAPAPRLMREPRRADLEPRRPARRQIHHDSRSQPYACRE